MPLQASPLDKASTQVCQCRNGDPQALADLREKCHASLMNILLSRGASRTETEDLLADLWADCVPGNAERPSLLEKFSGKCTLLGWRKATLAAHEAADVAGLVHIGLVRICRMRAGAGSPSRRERGHRR